MVYKYRWGQIDNVTWTTYTHTHTQKTNLHHIPIWQKIAWDEEMHRQDERPVERPLRSNLAKRIWWRVKRNVFLSQLGRGKEGSIGVPYIDIGLCHLSATRFGGWGTVAPHQLIVTKPKSKADCTCVCVCVWWDFVFRFREIYECIYCVDSADSYSVGWNHWRHSQTYSPARDRVNWNE